MPVERNYAIAIATLCDWLKNLAPVFQAIRSEAKNNCDFSRALSKIQLIDRNSDWFIALFVTVVISRSN